MFGCDAQHRKVKCDVIFLTAKALGENGSSNRTIISNTPLNPQQKNKKKSDAKAQTTHHNQTNMLSLKLKRTVHKTMFTNLNELNINGGNCKQHIENNYFKLMLLKMVLQRIGNHDAF